MPVIEWRAQRVLKVIADLCEWTQWDVWEISGGYYWVHSVFLYQASSGMPRADMMMVHLRCKDITNLGEIGRGRGE